MTTGHLHLGVALDGAGRHPAAWRSPHARPAELFDPRYWVELARTAERGLLDFVRLDDSLGSPSTRIPGRLDAVSVAARLAPATGSIGLIPTATTTHTEPFHVSTSIATLDHVSRGRAGWWPQPSRTAAEARHFGRKPVASAGELSDEQAEFVDVVGRLWDSWEDDAIIRDVATSRFLDRKKLHYVDFEGTYFDVRGPSITPRPPQGRPVIAITVDGPDTLEIAARFADVLFVDASGPDEARRLRERAHAIAEGNGRDPGELRVLAEITVYLAATDSDARRERGLLDARSDVPVPNGLSFTGTPEALADRLAGWYVGGAVDGFTLIPGVLPYDLDRIVEDLVPILRERGLARAAYTADTLRGHLGLPLPANRYART
ncbi:LLM class flavin-dependent oxidoreductase [Embleya scabrispora]|uniref:LLM class flavin-dependent oxidoreductase n=1 Tax=Embleya scabrispora TaxID=159449 RepID=UPI0003798697|nr:LLM class flavin-dependent oxidoreductase [Embleya scabrispora]MYS81858.1 LLM class flavin-dependent oxidoreductase [Streptomyces sp. SID5474]